MKIVIMDNACTGKSTIAYAIKEFLVQKGFDVNLLDKEIISQDYFSPDKQEARINSLKEQTKIEIDIIQTAREGKGVRNEYVGET